MAKKYLLDTNIAIRILNGKVDLEPYYGEGIELHLCLTAAGELYFGASNSARSETNRHKVSRLTALCPMLPQDLSTAKRYGDLKAELRKRGTPLPENDVWIAATALRYETILVTRDQHFDKISELETVTW